MCIIFKQLEDDYILSVIYGRLLKIISRYNLASDSNKALDIFIDIANDFIQNYFYYLYLRDKEKLSKSEQDKYRLSDWKLVNKDFILKFDETNVEVGAKVVNWLKNIDILLVKLVVVGLKERHNVLLPTERVLKTLTNKEKLKPLPRRLPMLIKPKLYSRIKVKGKIKEELGGYLLNDDKYTDELIIQKWNFKQPTVIKDKNVIYDLINNISSVGYKINKDVLNFIYTYGIRYKLIMATDYDHPLL